MINKSKRRDAVLQVLQSTVSHPTAEWVYEQAKQIIPNISLGTVYRNLNELVEDGRAIKVQGVFEKDRFDANANNHYHLVCSNCNAVVDIEPSYHIDIEKGQVDGCKVDNYSLTFYGLCPECNK